jgi:hypothetical protein
MLHRGESCKKSSVFAIRQVDRTLNNAHPPAKNSTPLPTFALPKSGRGFFSWR